MMWDLLVREPARHLYRLLKNEDYRRWQRLTAKLSHKPRYVEGRARVFEWDLRIPDAASFLSAFFSTASTTFLLHLKRPDLWTGARMWG
jgi:hypothetical protein